MKLTDRQAAAVVHVLVNQGVHPGWKDVATFYRAKKKLVKAARRHYVKVGLL